MMFSLANALLAFAPAPSQNGQQPTAPWWSNLFPLVLMLGIFYLILIRPQHKKAKQHDILVKSLKPGDKILTSSGILGTVVAVKDKSVSIRSSDSKLEVLKSAVSEITERTPENSQS